MSINSPFRPQPRERKFTIGIDARAALSPKTGDRTYILNLLRGLAALELDVEKWQFQLLLDTPDEAGVLPASPCFEPSILRAPNSRLWTLGVLPLHVRRSALDLVHVQYLAPPLLPCPFVTAIHDVVWRAFPETFPRLHRTVMNFGMPRTARRAVRVLCGTHSAARDIRKYLPVSSRKIRVTPYAIDPIFFEEISQQQIREARQKYNLGDAPYVLSVGVLQPRKNLPRLQQAFELCLQKHPDWPYQLVIVGKEGWGEDAKNENPNSKIIATGYVDDADLPALYAGASCFAYPSLYEGFGLPILEAMASGAPVLTSDNGAMREVAGSCATLVNPFSVEDIARGLEEALTGKPDAQNARKHAREFSIQNQARATLDVYAEVLAAQHK